MRISAVYYNLVSVSVVGETLCINYFLVFLMAVFSESGMYVYMICFDFIKFDWVAQLG